MPAWGVKLRTAGPEVRAKHRIIRGVLVEQVVPQGSPPGLRTGDIIITYTGTVNDVVMGKAGITSAKAFLENKAKWGGCAQSHPRQSDHDDPHTEGVEDADTLTIGHRSISAHATVLHWQAS
jgi:hypothetical protein